MPNRERKYGKVRRSFKLGVNVTAKPSYKNISEDDVLEGTKKDYELVVPKSIAGMLTHKRYVQLRTMGILMGDIGALCQLADDGEFPGELLFSGKKKQILDKKYKKARIAMRHKLNARWVEMRDERVKELKKAAAKLAKRNAAKRKKQEAAKEKKMALRAKKKTKRSALNKKTIKFPRAIGKSKPVIPTSYTDGNAPEINSPHD